MRKSLSLFSPYRIPIIAIVLLLILDLIKFTCYVININENLKKIVQFFCIRSGLHAVSMLKNCLKIQQV